MIQSHFLSILGPSGSGKTTFTANLGLAFTRLGYDTLIIDNNSFPALGFHFNLPFPNKTIQKTKKNKQSIETAMYRHPSGLKLLLNNPLEPYEKIHFDMLDGLAQIILIDGQKFKNNIVLLNYNMPSLMNGIKEMINANTIGIVLNKLNSVNISEENMIALANKENLLSINFEETQKTALKQGIPLFEMYPDNKFSMDILKLASGLIGKEYQIHLEQHD